MQSITNKPLTKMADLPTNVIGRARLDLTKSDAPDLEKKIQEVISKIVKKIPGAIVGRGSNEDVFVMASITSSKSKDKTLVFPEPNPVIIYYNSGIEHVKKAIEIKEEMLSSNYNSDELYEVFCNFFKEAFQGITQMIMAIESLFNQKIPENIQLEYDGEVLSKSNIEWKKFKTKIRYILPLLTEIDFYANYNEDYKRICTINSLRNDLIHMKSLKEDNFTYYESLYKNLIDFDYKTHCNSIHNFITMLLNT